MISNVTIVMKYLRHKYMFPMTKSTCDAQLCTRKLGFAPMQIKYHCQSFDDLPTRLLLYSFFKLLENSIGNKLMLYFLEK